MTDCERDILVAERVMGWQWEMKQTNTDWWTRTLLPPDQIWQYTPIWDGRKCDYVDTNLVGYFNPSIYPSAALQVKDHMEEVHGFVCGVNYFTGPAEPWCVMFKNFHVTVRRVGGTLQEAIVRAVLSDKIMDSLGST